MPGVHARLLVDDVAATADFYRDHLGFDTRFEAHGIYIELVFADAILGIYQRDLMTAIVGETALAPGPVLVCVDTVDVDGIAARLDEAGIALVTPPTDRPEWVLRTLHVADPAGNLVEVNQPLPDASG